MYHALSTHVIANHRLTTVWLERIWEAGIPAVEIFCARQHLDYRNRAQIAELEHFFRDTELTFHSLHSPLYTDEVWGRSGPHAVITITEPVKAKRVQMVDEIKRALEVAEHAPFRYLIQHIGVEGEEFDERKLDAAFTALEELSVFARQRGVDVLLENTLNALSTPEQLNWFLNETHLDLGYCFDTGHAHIREGIPAAFETMKDRIRSTHIHDNDGRSDGHLFPFLSAGGSIDWAETMRLLRSRADQYALLLELSEDPEAPQPLEAARRVFERLESL
ncbi:MAG: sugar phosphate isomerase/epimerase [Bryobacterales bacterium]|jgi:sugar phosphate isomerase/epimerase|nr:sugar phosphate isomerase/epimerase [Bryobacterales bacterium]